MKKGRLHFILRSIFFVLFAVAMAGAPLAAPSQNTTATAAIKAIDTDCLAIQNAVMALHPALR